MAGARRLFAAAVVGVILVVGSWLPASGIANATDVNEGLAAAQAAEAARQGEIDRLLDALGADPENTDTLSDLADAYLAGSTGDELARAAAALQVLIALEPDRADAYERLIGAYLRAGDYVNGRRALDSYEDRETADPVEVAFFDGLIALTGENDPEHARAAFDRFLELAPDDPRAEMIRGLRAQADRIAEQPVSSGASSDALPPLEAYVQIGDARLFTRVVGSGPPMIVLHGGPDFDHTYLLPELDRLAQHARLIYYDQRGRGRSADGVRPEDVTLASEMSDLDGLRHSIGVESVGLIGHSWGGLLAMEYAARHPDRVTRLILLNTAPASHADWVSLGERLPRMRAPGEADRMREIASSSAFRAGDLDAEAAYYLIHFRQTVPDPQLLRTIVDRLRMHFDPGRVRLARAIEDRLYEETSNCARVRPDPTARGDRHADPSHPRRG